MKRALIVQGGWEGHEPEQVAEILKGALETEDFEVEVRDTLDAFKELDLQTFDLIVPIWTMGHIESEQLTPLLEAVRSGVGIAGVHGGMADAFREQTEYQYMVGGQWVAHPGGDGVEYTVHIVENVDSPITEGLHDFTVCSEQYYMHVDPGNNVLATTRFGDVVMPVTWTKTYGKGRVFYTSLGHVADVFNQDPQILTMVRRGMVWAARDE
ncbi:MAG: ThuA domain-containing protein [Chloroflexota bacterium]|nr:ThuA domain-containing protein [Chloroflexota bacterium]